MYVTDTPSAHLPGADLLVNFFVRVPTWGGESQKSKAIADARNAGYFEAILEGLADAINGLRCEHYAKMGRVPILTGTDCRAPILAAIEAAEVIKASDLTHREKSLGMRGLASETIMALVDTEELQAAEFERHKRAVLDGTESALANDITWLEPMLNEANNRALELAALLTKPELSSQRAVIAVGGND